MDILLANRVRLRVPVSGFLSAVLRFPKTTGKEKRLLCLGPAGLGQIAQDCSDSFALCQRDMIEIQGARHRHAVLR